MSDTARHDAWTAGDSYEAFMGRWSRHVAPFFLDWLAVPPGADWLDLGCGTGALTRAILDRAAPSSVTGLDASPAFVEAARARNPEPIARFRAGDAMATGLPPGSFDAVASALLLNFLPDRPRAWAEMRRVARPGATLAAYVWDYPARMGMLNLFWRAAAALDPQAVPLAESTRFGFCTPGTLLAEAREAGLSEPRTTSLPIRMEFQDFDDLWHPFTLAAGPAGGYVTSLDPPARDALRDRLRAEAQAASDDGRIILSAQALAIAGRAP